MPHSEPLPPPSPHDPPRTAPSQRRRRALWGCGGLIALLLIIVATVAITIWWIQRPIKPVVLSAAEKRVVEAKLQQVRSALPTTPDERLSPPQRPNPSPGSSSNRYVAGGKELRLTERELNGLLNQKTDLGKTVRLELDPDAINAYVAVPIPKDFPVGAGRTFRARGRFHLALSKGQAPVAMLEDVTVLGLSLPKEWLGGMKSRNLLADAVGERSDAATWKGIKSLRVVPGALILEVGD